MTEEVRPSGSDRIYIRDLIVRCTIGIDEQERANKQNVLVQITMETDLRRAGRTDALEDTIDYRALKKRILSMAGESQFYLIEALAESIADECLKQDRIERVTVAVEKPGALRFARTVGVEIVRRRDGAEGRSG